MLATITPTLILILATLAALVREVKRENARLAVLAVRV